MKKNPFGGLSVPPKAKKSKLDSIFDQLESSNSAFLNAAAQRSMASELARVKPASHPIAPSPMKASSNAPIFGLPVDGEEAARRAERRQRFLAEQEAAAAVAGQSATLVQARKQHGEAAKGKNTNLEKEYLRLTSLPNVADVRPPAVLENALELIRQKWKEGVSYKYACDQLKSIRQDLTVQHVKSALTVAVYETHSRIALEVQDWAELRQSLAVLKTLYAELAPRSSFTCRTATQPTDGGGGSGGGAGSSLSSSSAQKKKMKKRKQRDNEHDADVEKVVLNESEFSSYLLILAAATGKEALGHELQAAAERGALTNADIYTTHALAACRAYNAGNYVALLQLYPDAPRMQSYLLDLLMERMRPRIWKMILAAFGGPSGVSLSDVSAWLGFGDFTKEARQWIGARGGILLKDGTIDMKASKAGLSRTEGEGSVVVAAAANQSGGRRSGSS